MFILVEARMPIQGEQALDNSLTRIRSVADYQFGKGVGKALFPENVQIEYSHSTGRIRYNSLNGARVATLRPTDGMLSISIEAARTLAKNCPTVPCFVTARQDISKFVADGGDLFAAHVVKADEEIRPKDEVVVVDEAGQVIAVGRAFLSSREMLAFKTGVAVKVRHGRGGES
jgi:uncharacterized protein with predicted RNA binding PUA domain